MKISDIMTEKEVLLLGKMRGKRHLLQELASAVSKILNIDERTVFEGLLERESLGSTGFGGGTALPHARIKEVKKVTGIFAKLSSPVDFDSVDNKPVDLIFALVSPENSGADHLTALAQISRLLKNDATCEKLRHAKDQDEVYSILI